MRRPSSQGRDSGARKRPGREQQTEAVLEAARRLFEKHGFDAVTTAEIAREANLSRTIVYKYAISKQDILRQILLERIDEQATDLLAFSFAETGGANSIDDVLAYFTAMMRGHMEHIDLLRLALSESWSWGPVAEAQVTIQLFRIFAPLQGRLRTKYGIELSEPARWALWAVYLESLRTASARYGRGHTFDARLWTAIFRPQLQLLWPGILAAGVSSAQPNAGKPKGRGTTMTEAAGEATQRSPAKRTPGAKTSDRTKEPRHNAGAAARTARSRQKER